MEEKELDLKIKAYELQELIAKAVQNYVAIIAVSEININDLRLHDKLLEITKNASSNFNQCFDPKNLKITVEETLKNIEALEGVSTYIQTLGEFSSLPKLMQDMSYYLNNLKLNKQEILSWLEKNNIQTLQEHWYKNHWYIDCRLLDEVFNQATFRIRSLELLAKTQKDFEDNNQKAEELICKCQETKNES